MNNTIAYVVHGSEDGNVGIYTTKERARQVAWNYVAQSGEDKPTLFRTRKGWKEEDGYADKFVHVVANQENVSKAFKETSYVSLEGNGVRADIQMFRVNA